MPPNNNQSTSDPYGFITNSPARPPKKPILDPTSMKTRIAVVVGGVLLLIIILVVVSSLLSQGSKAQTQKMIDVATAQSEIIRVSTLAEKDIRSSSTLNYALTTRIAVQSSQSSLIAKLQGRGINSKKLASYQTLAKNTKVDQTLEEANTNNRFDETYLSILNESLANYQKLLVNASGGATKSEKDILLIAWEGAETLKKNDLAASPGSKTNGESESTGGSSIIDNDVGSGSEE